MYVRRCELLNSIRFFLGCRRKNCMKTISIIIVLSINLFYGGCKSNSTDIKEDNTPRLVLTADSTKGQSPLGVTFKGYFYGTIDTILVKLPPYFLFPNNGRTIIRYSLPNETTSPEQSYIERITYSYPGTYKAVMVIQGKYRDYWSDTLSITVY